VRAKAAKATGDIGGTETCLRLYATPGSKVWQISLTIF
jgi:hypothetical protein